LPNDEPDCRLLAKDCRKFARLVSLPFPPRSAIKLLKLVCKELSADATVLVVSEAVDVDVDEALDPVVRAEIRPCRSAANPLLEPAPEAAPEGSTLWFVPLELLLSDCALSAAIKFCMKFWNADTTSLEEEELDAADAVPGVVEAVLDAAVVAAVVAAAAVPAVVAEVAPIEASASKMAVTKPLADCGVGVDPEVSVLDALEVD